MARKLDEIRKQQGVGVRELLEKAGVSSRAFYNITKRRGAEARLDTIHKISRALGVYPEDVLEFREALGIGPDEEIFIVDPSPPPDANRYYRLQLRDVMDRLPEEIVEREYRAFKRRRAMRRKEEDE